MRDFGQGFISLFLHRHWHVTWAFYLDFKDWNWPTLHPDDMMTDHFRWIIQAGPFELIRWPDETET